MGTGQANFGQHGVVGLRPKLASSLPAKVQWGESGLASETPWLAGHGGNFVHGGKAEY